LVKGEIDMKTLCEMDDDENRSEIDDMLDTVIELADIEDIVDYADYRDEVIEVACEKLMDLYESKGLDVVRSEIKKKFRIVV
jgi:hypothetical protein